MQQLKSRLKLNKKTIATLDKRQLNSIKGGFTYSLSLGQVCISEKQGTGCGTITGTCACCNANE